MSGADLSRVFLNLVNNACYATHEKSKAVAAIGRVDYKPTLTVSTKKAGDNFYILSGSATNASQTVEFSLACGAAESVMVVDENRTISVRGQKFSDTFADGNAVHVYEVAGATGSCTPLDE